MNNETNDVIERMWKEFHRKICRGSNAQNALRAALRAVSDTHRLVPVKPTEKMIAEGAWGDYCSPEEHWSWMMDAAPDYTNQS